jgi:arsenite methyltransferase
MNDKNDNSDEGVRESVRDYYGNVLQSSEDLQTNACCVDGSVVDYHKPILGKVHDEVLSRFYGCGSPIPEGLKGMTVVDLGCGTGRDAYLCSALVGETGRVIGIDMTDEQLEVARRHVQFHADAFGFSAPNTEFRKGVIEDLSSAGIEDASVDVVISNCVINLAANKGEVFREILRVLKPGGELYFSDVFSDRRVPADLAADPVLLGECLGGALYKEDFRRLMSDHGCFDVRTVSSRRLTIENPELEAQVAPIEFYSETIRAFKLPLEDRCEDFGQTATYLGTLPHHEQEFVLDDHHVFRAGEAVAVCGNTAEMVSGSRFGAHFRVDGDQTTHHGLFDCGPVCTPTEAPTSSGCC